MKTDIPKLVSVASLSHDLREDFNSPADIGGRDIQVGDGTNGFGVGAEHQHLVFPERSGQRGGVFARRSKSNDIGFR
jgi:hypothetical protein